MSRTLHFLCFSEHLAMHLDCILGHLASRQSLGVGRYMLLYWKMGTNKHLLINCLTVNLKSETSEQIFDSHLKDHQVLNALLDEFHSHRGQFRYSIDVIKSIDELDYSLSGQVPLLSFVEKKVLNQHRCLMNANINVLVVSDNAEGYCGPSFWNGRKG